MAGTRFKVGKTRFGIVHRGRVGVKHLADTLCIARDDPTFM